MCLPVSRLFWVSSLAYPNLLGTKGYVVVVVVVVNMFLCYLKMPLIFLFLKEKLVQQQMYFMLSLLLYNFDIVI
jgi:hypothetical protein